MAFSESGGAGCFDATTATGRPRLAASSSRALRVDREKLSDRTRRGDLEEWDSLGHLVLVEALSEEFKVNISPESALDMETIHDIKLVISRLQEQQS